MATHLLLGIRPSESATPRPRDSLKETVKNSINFERNGFLEKTLHETGHRKTMVVGLMEKRREDGFRNNRNHMRGVCRRNAYDAESGTPQIRFPQEPPSPSTRKNGIATGLSRFRRTANEALGKNASKTGFLAERKSLLVDFKLFKRAPPVGIQPTAYSFQRIKNQHVTTQVTSLTFDKRPQCCQICCHYGECPQAETIPSLVRRLLRTEDLRRSVP